MLTEARENAHLEPGKAYNFRMNAAAGTMPGSRILGLDPGLNITGFGLIERRPGLPCRVLEAGVLRTPSSKKQADLGARLHHLHAGLAELIADYQPTAVAVEQLYAHYAHPRTAIIMGHARGVLLLAAGQAGIAVSHYGATRIKKTICGHGRAAKEEVQRAVMRDLGLMAAPEPYDVTDALAVALCHAYALNLAATDARKRAV
jgi:crossover junction endodeoxyribonuclease RuvC